MQEYLLKYGKGTVSVRLDGANVLGVLQGAPTPPVGDIRAALFASLDNPIDSPALRDYLAGCGKLALIISDMSRFWMRQDLVIPHLLDYICEGCGLPHEAITIIVANGTHQSGGEAELRTLVTEGVYDRVKVINHDCMAEDLVFMGATSYGTRVSINPAAANADRVICLGACTHHVMAGFGGGRKSILPGISALSTIRENHSLALDPSAPRSNPLIGTGVLEGNPLHLDMCEAAALMPSLFMINLVMNGDMQLSHIYSGHWLNSWLEGCRAADAIYHVPIAEKADVIIASCGGFPKDMSLYQGTKTIDNLESSLKAGGTLIVAMEAIEGGGPPEYFDWIEPLKRGRLYEELKEGFTIPGYIFFLNCEQAARYRIMMLTSVPPETLAPMGIEAYSDMDSLMAAADITGKSVYVIPNGSTVIPHLKG